MKKSKKFLTMKKKKFPIKLYKKLEDYNLDYSKHISHALTKNNRELSEAAKLIESAKVCIFVDGENILHDDHVTWAPKWTNVSISTAVWIVMCKQPAILEPVRGLLSPYSSLIDISPGISASANFISFLPHSDKEMSLTL